MVKQDKYFLYDNQTESVTKQRIGKLVSLLKAAYFRIKMLGIHVNNNSKKYNVAVCAIFKDEALYLKEWIEFNHIVGVEHFYLYNNNSGDGFHTILQPYIESGLVTLNEWPQQQKQMECYKNCIARFAGETKWLGFIDIDEFVVPKYTDTIYEFLRPFEKKAGAVLVYWKLFGTSGRLDRTTDGFVSEDFTSCWPKYCDIGKCFYNTAFGFNMKSKYSSQLHHKFWASYKGTEFPPVNVFNRICVGNRNVASATDFPIQINHYFTKSYKEYAAKRVKGDVYFAINPHDEAYFYEHEMKCTSTDYSAYRYLIKLKLKIESDKNCEKI